MAAMTYDGRLQDLRPTHDVDGLMEMLAAAFKASLEGGPPLQMQVDGGLLNFTPCSCCGQLSQGQYIDLLGPLDEWLPEGWAER